MGAFREGRLTAETGEIVFLPVPAASSDPIRYAVWQIDPSQLLIVTSSLVRMLIDAFERAMIQTSLTEPERLIYALSGCFQRTQAIKEADRWSVRRGATIESLLSPYLLFRSGRDNQVKLLTEASKRFIG